MTAQADSFDISPYPELGKALAAARSRGRTLRLVQGGAEVG